MNNSNKIIVVVWNPESGIASSESQIKNSLKKLEQQYTLYQVSVEKILDYDTLLERVPINECSHIIAIGGDGTVSAVSDIAMKHDLPLLVIPNGTFNHFATHLGLPMDIGEAFALIDSGELAHIDIATVNEKVFVNFISAGFYADVIKTRSLLQKQGGRKWTSFARSLMKEAFHNSRFSVSFTSPEGATFTKETPLLLIANGTLSFGSPDILNDRHSFTSGKLQVLLFKNYGRGRLFLIALASMFFDTTKWNVTEEFQVKDCRIIIHKDKPKIVMDGELIEIDREVVVKNHPRALHILVPDSQEII